MSIISAFKSRPFLAWTFIIGTVLAVIVGTAAVVYSRSHPRLTVFEDVTLSSGLSSYVGMTFGAAWGDFDGDGLPDLYVTNHLNGAKLYRNLGNGRFADV